MPPTDSDTGVTARRVAANVNRLRADKGRRSLAWVAQRMTDLGYPTHESQVSRIETGKRRVTPDDLMALAIALDATPNQLLLPTSASPDVEADLTPTVTVTNERAWQWATGELPLLDTGATVREEGGRRMLVLDDLGAILARAPHHPLDPMPVEALVAHLGEMVSANKAVKALQAKGFTRRQIFNGLTLVDVILDAQSRLEGESAE